MRYFKSTDAFTFIELMVVIAILAILSAIVIPNYIAYRNKAFCSEAETNASGIAGAIADYFGTGARTQTPDISDLKITVQNPVVITGVDPNLNITIEVTDRTRRCPIPYQDAHDGWDSNYVFTKNIH